MDHIVKSYDHDLLALKARVIEMGGLVQKQLGDALTCVLTSDPAQADEIISRDPSIDAFERSIDIAAVKILALRHPVAQDLRTVLVALKISSDLERIADYAANMAKRSKMIQEKLPQTSLDTISEMVDLCHAMLEGVVEAYREDDVQKAINIWHCDHKIDEIYGVFLRDLLNYMMQNPNGITSCTQLLFIAKNIERIGDHLTNVAEMIYYQVEASSFSERKDKSLHSPS